MHYANGRPVKIGDKIIVKEYSGNFQTRIVTALYPGSDRCNIGFVPMGNQQSANAKDSLHVEDAFNSGVPRAQI